MIIEKLWWYRYRLYRTNTVQVPITTGTVTDSGSEYTGFIEVISRYIYKAGKLWALAGWPSTWLECWSDRPGTHMWWGRGEEKVVSVDARSQPDVGWLAATSLALCRHRCATYWMVTHLHHCPTVCKLRSVTHHQSRTTVRCNTGSHGRAVQWWQHLTDCIIK